MKNLLYANLGIILAGIFCIYFDINTVSTIVYMCIGAIYGTSLVTYFNWLDKQ